MGPAEQNALLTEVGKILASAILDDWEEIRFVFSGVVDISMPGMTVLRPDDSTVALTPPRKASRLMRELREGMHEPDGGAWFTARVLFDRSGTYRADFDFEGEPVLDFPLANGSFVTDLERFPRDERTSGWLRARLDLATGSRRYGPRGESPDGRGRSVSSAVLCRSRRRGPAALNPPANVLFDVVHEQHVAQPGPPALHARLHTRVGDLNGGRGRCLGHARQIHHPNRLRLLGR
jgi:hypothetical protein